MHLSRYQSLPTHPLKADDSTQAVDEGPSKCSDNICSSFPVVTFFALLLVAVVSATALSLSLTKSPGIFIENSVYSATCVENLCLFGFSEYPRDISCTEDRHCATYYDPCASNPCSPEGTSKCIRGPKGGYACLCKDRHGGPRCETKIHPCDYDQPCFGQATCVKHPTEREWFSCRCQVGWMGSQCRYRSQLGDTCANDNHCSNRGKCLQRNARNTCHCFVGYHGLHCLDTFDVKDCPTRPCKELGKCIEKEEGYDCLCKLGRIGKHCHRVMDTGDCGLHCQNGGRCDTDLEGLPVCKCEKGYGGDFCVVRDVSRYRHYKGGSMCQCHASHSIRLHFLIGRWFLVALKKNTYNPPDGCVQLSFVEKADDLKNVLWRNHSLAIRYMAIRNDTSSHHTIHKIAIDEMQTIVYDSSAEGLNSTQQLVMMGSLARLYAFPLTRIQTHDDQPIVFGVVYQSKGFLVLHSCITDETHGHFDSLLVLAKEKDDVQGLENVLQDVYKELPYVTGRMVMMERNGDCKD